MVDASRMLKHLAYFEELAAMEESDDAWLPVSSGLVVLRLVDAWLAHGPSAVAPDAFGVGAVRSAVYEIREGDPVRSILESILDGMKQAKVAKMHAVAPRMLAYARALEYEARWSLASDVYRTVVAHVHPSVDSEYAIDGQIRLGACLRNLGDIDGAAAAYRVAGQVSTAANDMVGVLRSRIGEAKIAIARGNMPSAEAILDDTIAKAGGKALRSVRSMALHDRSHVAHLREDHELAVKLAYRALEESDQTPDRDRILADVAASFAKLGVYSAAHDAYMILAVTAQEQYVRWLSQLNLLDIAATTGSEPLFERYRREVANLELPPRMAVYRELHTGQGYMRLGKAEEGIPFLHRAVELATGYGFNKLVFDAEAALEQASRAAPITESEPAAPVGDEVWGIATALKQMREMVASGT